MTFGHFRSMWKSLFLVKGFSDAYFYFNCILHRIFLSKSNYSVDPDHTPRSAVASGPDLQCLHMSPKFVPSFKRVKWRKAPQRKRTA